MADMEIWGGVAKAQFSAKHACAKKPARAGSAPLNIIKDTLTKVLPAG